ncbi:small multi-drug export protein, partial [Acinetobacter baumannii]|nr:small multi-drug export protein [Acinetobacter baumannii]
KNKPKIDKYGFWGLMLFVGIPLPGTGAWTGSLVAALFDMDVKKATISILLGVFLAAVIMTLVSYGALGALLG